MKTIDARLEILSAQEIEALHQATLEVLATTGCRLPHRRVQDLFQAAGAQVDPQTATVRLPSQLVERALREVNKPAAATPGNSRVRFGIHPGNQALIIDYPGGERRTGTTEDVVKGIVLCNELSHVVDCMPLVTPGDVPAYMSDLYGYYLCTLYSRKPYSVYIYSPEAARQIIRVWELAREEPGRAGSEPTISYLLEPNGSLSYDQHSLEMALIFADAGQRFHLGPMVMAGLDGPVTLAGTLVVQNAINLVGIALSYLLGVPGSWSGSAHTLDLRSALCSFGSPNQVLLGLAAVQLGHHYGFPVSVNSGLTDACLPDFQAGFEKGMTGMVALLAGADGIGAQGIVGADQGTSFEQLVIDNEWARAVDHIFQLGCEVNAETLAVEVIQQVGIGGSYLAEEHTQRHMRETYWPATLFNQASWDAWHRRGAQEVYQAAHARVQAILAAHYPPEPLLQPAVVEELEALVRTAAAHPEAFTVS
jgi:trimethylamine--corrinoid protein Co-methyltransferase